MEAFTKMPRTMANGDLVLPSSISFVVKSISNFDYLNQAAEAQITGVLRIRISGMTDDQELADFIKSSLKCRINEVEQAFIEDLTARV